MRFPLLSLITIMAINLLSRDAWGQSAVVLPSCGTSATHFTLSVGGAPTPSCPNNDCSSGFSIYVDGYRVPGGPGKGLAPCVSGFSTDLRQAILAATNCPGCLAPGDHTVKVTSFAECAPDRMTNGCVQTTFTVVSSTPDPWVNDLQFLNAHDGGDSVVITFNPAGSCGLPDCQAIYLIQSARLRAIVGPDTLCVPITPATYPSLSAAEIAKLQATRTPGCTRIDAGVYEQDPYMNGLDLGADNGAPGRSGPNPAASVAWDLPHISSAVDTVIDEFEVNAYCGAGKSRGRYLGKTFWIYRVPPGAPGVPMRHPRLGPDLAGPTPEFAKADSLWRKERGFKLPKPSPPSKSGVPCQ